jgi:hypothetical protein
LPPRRIAHVHAQFADSATDVAMLVTHYRAGRRVATRGMLMEPRRARLGRVLQRRPVRAGRQARARALCGRDQRLRAQPAHAADRSERWRTSTSCRAASTRRVHPSAERAGSDRAAEVLFVGRLLHGKGCPCSSRRSPSCAARGST